MKLRINQTQLFLSIVLLIPIIIFLYPTVILGRMPIPADTIVGMYHPFRDVTWKGLTAGVPFKNFLITDAVRQQYPWRELAINILKKGEYPGWNPYTFSGTPLAANIQTALFYPLNLLFFIFNFNTAWTIQIILQPILLTIFMYLYLQEIGFSKKASIFSSLSLTFSGFSIAWLEWNTTLHTLVWLPLALFAVEKIMKKANTKWFFVLGFSLASILFAGFLQTSFYVYLLIGSYLVFKIFTTKNQFAGKKKFIRKLIFLFLLVLLITSIQWIPSAKLISHSARETDLGNALEREDWFIPWKNLIQFIAPDFFGNPTTLNYWGIFNYTEFIGYIGLFPLILALYGMFPKKKNKDIKIFFTAVLFSSLTFATPNIIAKIPFQLNIPFLSTAQPSRLIILIDFSLAVLVAFGAERLLMSIKEYRIALLKQLFAVFSVFSITIGGLWVFISFFGKSSGISSENLSVSQRNLILPTITFIAITGTILSLILFLKTKNNLKNRYLITKAAFILLFVLTVGDLLRFAWKFTPFTDSDYLYPSTKLIEFLQKDKNTWRYMTTDRRIFPPNFSITYRMQTIEGYDPLYLRRYGQLITTAQENKPTLEPKNYNRIIRPDNIKSPIYNLLNVKYVLSLSDIENPQFEKVFQEGETKVYENKDVFPRVFFISNYKNPADDLEALKQIFDLKKEDIEFNAKITSYAENKIIVQLDSQEGGMLVLSDNYYPGWIATIDGSPIEIHRVLYTLRGTIVPSGQHEIIYRYSQL